MGRISDLLDNGAGQFIHASATFRLTLTGLASGTTADVALGDLPADAIPVSISDEVVTAVTFGAGTTTAATVSVGITGSLTLFATAGAASGRARGAVSDLGGPGTGVGRLRATTALVARVTASAGGAPDVDEISAGEVLIHVAYRLPKRQVLA